MKTKEQKIITVQTRIDAPLDLVWKLWSTPEDIINWNNASADWHTPRAENNLRTGGKFNYRMEAVDGSEGFDFWGVYDKVILKERIDYTMGDGRKVSIAFSKANGKTKIVENFEPETDNPVEKQHDGWQSILDNFKRYAEVKSAFRKSSQQVAHQITPCLWFDNQAEEAARYYVSIFSNSKIGKISYYTKEGVEIHGQEPGTVLTVDFTINGQPFTALNGGPVFKFSEAVSFQVYCDTQQEIDSYWDKLIASGDEGQCGWLKDKYGLSWQIVPSILSDLLSDPIRAERVMKALMQMKKLEIDKLIKA